MAYKYEFNISHNETGLLAMFKVKNYLLGNEDMESHLDLEFRYLGATEKWYFYNLTCSSPEARGINDLLITIGLALKKNKDVHTVDDLIKFCKSIGKVNTDIFSYRYEE